MHSHLADFHTARYRALDLAFRAGEPSELREFEVSLLEDLAKDCLDLITQIRSPFDEYLEAPQSICDLYAQFGERIKDGVAIAKTAITDLLIQVTPMTLGVPPDHTVDGNDLRRNGFDPATPRPDELDHK